MTTPLKALIQERLRAKIVRQEVDGDDVDGLLTMDTHHHHHHHREHQHHHHRDMELPSPSHGRAPVRGAGNVQRTFRQSQQIQEDSSHGNPYLMEDTSSRSQRQKRHQQQHQTQPQQQQSEHYSTNQKLIDYYTYEHHQKFDGYFRQDRSFGRGFRDERYKTLGYEQQKEKEDSRSPLVSPWRGQSAPSNNKFHDQDPEEEDEEERDDVQQEQQQPKPVVGGVESPRYAPLLPPSPSPSSQQQQQQQQHRSASAELRHVRECDSRVHPVDLHSFRNARESQQEPELPMSLAYDNNNNSARERDVYPRGHFESQLYDGDVHDSKQEEEDPTESRHELRHHKHHHHKHGHHKQQRHRHEHRQGIHRTNTTASFEDPESPRHVLLRKRGFGTFEDPYEVVNDDTVNYKPHERLARLRHYEDTVSDSIDNDTNLLHNTEKHEPELSYSSHHGHGHHHDQRQRHYFNHDRFGNSAFYVDNLVTSPLAAASSLAPLVVAAATSPRLETKRASGSIERQQQKSNVDTGMPASSSLSISYASLGALPAPLDMAMVETTRRLLDDFDAMPHTSSDHNSLNNSHNSIINRRSSSTLFRRLGAILSPGCHRAATAFVEKRRRRTANSTPRTMATQRWLQSMDPQFRERVAADAATCEPDLQYPQHQYQYQETPLVLPASFSAARSASSCSNRSSSSSASSCASSV